MVLGTLRFRTSAQTNHGGWSVAELRFRIVGELVPSREPWLITRIDMRFDPDQIIAVVQESRVVKIFSTHWYAQCWRNRYKGSDQGRK
jgi:hypothetical protein